MMIFSHRVTETQSFHRVQPIHSVGTVVSWALGAPVGNKNTQSIPSYIEATIELCENSVSLCLCVRTKQ